MISVCLWIYAGAIRCRHPQLGPRHGNDLLVQEVITNYSEKPIDYTAFAAYPDLTRQERIVQGLEPGRTTVEAVYRFKNVKFIPGATPALRPAAIGRHAHTQR